MHRLERQLGIRDKDGKRRRSWSMVDVVLIVVVLWLVSGFVVLWLTKYSAS